MIQEVITYIIIAWAVFQTVTGALKIFGISGRKKAQHSCGNGQCSCSVSR